MNFWLAELGVSFCSIMISEVRSNGRVEEDFWNGKVVSKDMRQEVINILLCVTICYYISLFFLQHDDFRSTVFHFVCFALEMFENWTYICRSDRTTSVNYVRCTLTFCLSRWTSHCPRCCVVLQSRSAASDQTPQTKTDCSIIVIGQYNIGIYVLYSALLH